MLASPAMEMQSEETPLALQRLWNLTRARLAGTSTALDEDLALVDALPAARVRNCIFMMMRQYRNCEEIQKDVAASTELHVYNFLKKIQNFWPCNYC